MKKFFVMLALALGATSAFAQNETDTVSAVSNHVTPVKDLYPQQEDGDLYHGLTRKLTFDRMVPPYGLEVTYDKTTHIIFPSAVRYVDLGSPNLVAGKADGAENVIRVKAVVKDFRNETNMSVITESGSFYTFNVKYADEPLLLNVEMKDFIHDGSKVNRPNNALDIYLEELGSESPKLVRLIMESIHKDNKRNIKHIGSKAFGIQYLLRGLYTHNGLLYFHTQIRNSSNVPFEVDFVTFKIMDKKVMKRTAIQEQVIFPLRAYNYATVVAGNKEERTVFTLDKFTIPADKVLVVELNEKSGGRHQSFTVENEDIVRAKVINELKVKYRLYHNGSRVACPVLRAGARPTLPPRNDGSGVSWRIRKRLEIISELLYGIRGVGIYQKSQPVGGRCGIPAKALRVQGCVPSPCAVHGRGRLLPEVPVRPFQDFVPFHRRLGSGRL